MPPRRRPPHDDSPDAVPEEPSVPELLGYLGLPDPLARRDVLGEPEDLGEHGE